MGGFVHLPSSRAAPSPLPLIEGYHQWKPKSSIPFHAFVTQAQNFGIFKFGSQCDMILIGTWSFQSYDRIPMGAQLLPAGL